MRDGIPGAYFGRQLTPGVRGWVIGRVILLCVAPPGRNLWSNRRSPLVLGRIVKRPDGGAELRLAMYRQRNAFDPAAEGLLDEWLDELSSDA
jgi:hypothetical protein